MGGGGEETHAHGPDRLCAAAEQVYARALRAGRVRRTEAAAAPCLVDLELLHPDVRDLNWFVPVPPDKVMAGLLREAHEEAAAGHRRVGELLEGASRFAGLDAVRAAPDSFYRLIEGNDRIQRVVDEQIATCSEQVLTIQPGGIRTEVSLREGALRTVDFQQRGVRMRTLYTHVARHGPGLARYLELVGDVVQIRTLEEVPERLFVFDRTVAYVPANKDRTLALEIRHPELVGYLATTFERLWRLALPLSTPLPAADADGISPRQRSIAALLAEGHTDAVVAERLGMNVRTCRAHIAKLAETLGAANRTQLGVRLAQAGLSDASRPGQPAEGPRGS
ncbi:helix-turn-helix transcriptional regulator [Streptomyces sp. NPDC050095]|uniref:helix-turn-helix transcriptional regulator n=1 Tax=unclassified Streptomyces TaxID=2593676 RepID=UPI003428D785